ncbi:MAG: hypothetical protein F4X77_13645 [Acidobacteriia bacterium]|nr:hypothetical protein [Terriglobia bacterium]
MTRHGILLLTSLSLLPASAASVEERLQIMHRHHPEADANGDGSLTEIEAMDYVVRVSGRRVNRGPAAGSPDLFDAFEERSHGETRYRLMQPVAFDRGTRYPLILSLHGGGGVGDDNVSQLRWWNGVMAKEEWRRAHPSFVVVPQAVSGGTWGERSQVGNLQNIYIKNMIPVVFELIEALQQELPIDESRIYVLGSSMGGSGTWNFLQARPGFFAAGIPVCAGRPPEDVKGLTQTPVWSFHGADDQTAPVENSRRMFDRVRAAGGSIKYTELRGIQHNSWIQAFTYTGDDPARGFSTRASGDEVDPTSDVWQWLFRQRRPDRN